MAVWKHETSVWTSISLSGVQQLVGGNSPDLRALDRDRPGGHLVDSGIWDSDMSPEIDWVIDLANQVPAAQELIVDTDATVFSVSMRGNSSTMQLHVANGVTLTVLEDVRVRGGGQLTLTGGTLNANTIRLTDGTISGSGDLATNVSNDGVVSPGLSAGSLNVDGDYTQTANGRLAIEIGGLTPASQYDQVVVTGDAVLAGLIDVSLVNGFTPSRRSTVRSASGRRYRQQRNRPRRPRGPLVQPDRG